MCVCRAIRPLDDFPLDGKRSHGRACYCRPCKRLRGRAAAVSRTYDVAWLRAALEAGELRQRLGNMAESVLVPSVPHKPVTTELSAHARLDWPPPGPGGSPAPSSVVARVALPPQLQQHIHHAHQQQPQQPPQQQQLQQMPQRHIIAHLRSPGGGAQIVSTGGSGGSVSQLPMIVKAGAGPLPALAAEPPLSRLPPLALPPPAPAPVAAPRPPMWPDGEASPEATRGAAPPTRGDSEPIAGATGITRSILSEHREFARMYLGVRERMLVPELSPAQLEVEQQTAMELEAHLHMLRDLIRKAFLG